MHIDSIAACFLLSDSDAQKRIERYKPDTRTQSCAQSAHDQRCVSCSRTARRQLQTKHGKTRRNGRFESTFRPGDGRQKEYGSKNPSLRDEGDIVQFHGTKYAANHAASDPQIAAAAHARTDAVTRSICKMAMYNDKKDNRESRPTQSGIGHSTHRTKTQFSLQNA